MSTSNANPIVSSARSLYESLKADTLAAAELMPESAYAFQPQPEVRSFAQQVAHIADANYLFSSSYFAESNPFPGVGPTQAGILEKTKKTKAEIVAALKASFEHCDRVFHRAVDAELGDDATLAAAPNAQAVNKAFLLDLTLFHGAQHYAAMAVYLRSKGIVPPSTRRFEAIQAAVAQHSK